MEKTAAPKIVDMPGLGLVEFPGTMDDAAIESVLRATPEANVSAAAPADQAARRAPGAAPSLLEAAFSRPLEAGLSGVNPIANRQTAAFRARYGPALIPNPMLSAIGSVAGEVAAQELEGAPKTDWAQAGLAALPAVPGLARAATLRLPGAAGGLQQLAVKTAEQLPGRGLSTSARAVDALYDALRSANPKIPTAPLEKAYEALTREEAKLPARLRAPLVRRALEAAGDLLYPVEGARATAINFDVLHATLKRVNDLTYQARQKGGDTYRLVAGVREALGETLERAEAVLPSGSTAGAALREANAAFQTLRASEELGDLIGRSIKHKMGLRQFNADKVLDAMTTGEARATWQRKLGADAYGEVVETLKALAKTPTVSNAQQPGIGSIPFAQRAIASGGLGALGGGSGLGLGSGGALGGAVVAVVAVEGLSNALLHPAGRRVIYTLAKHGYSFDKISNVAVQFLRDPGARAQAEAFLRQHVPGVRAERPTPGTP